jgi:hypothetical protein
LYFMPCAPCQVIHGFDAVEAALKRNRVIAKEPVSGEAEDFTLALPTAREEER